MPGFGAGILFGEFQRQLGDLVDVSDKSFIAIGLSAARLEDSFTRMSARMGLSATGLMAAMRSASNNSISDMSLMQNAMRAFDFGVAQNADDIQKLLEVAQDRGRRAGLSTERAFNDLVTGLGRLSPRILDNLNIILNTRQVYEDYAQSIGKTADQLTDFEKRAALSTAVMAEAHGIVADQKTGWEQMRTAIANATAELGRFVSGAAGPLFANVATGLNTGTAIEKATREMSAAFSETAHTTIDLHWNVRLDEAALETIRQQWLNLQRAFQAGEITQPAFEEGVLHLRAALQVINPFIDDYSTSLDEAAQEEEIFNRLAGKVGDSLDEAARAEQAAAEAARAAGTAFFDLGRAMNTPLDTAGALELTQNALNGVARSAESLAGVVGADRAGEIYNARAAAVEAYGKTLVDLPTEQARIAMNAFTAAFDEQDAVLRRAGDGVSTYNQEIVYQAALAAAAAAGGMSYTDALLATAAGAGNAAIAMATLGAAMSGLPDITGAMNATQTALNEVARGAEALAGVVGADQAVAIYAERTAAVEAYGKSLVGMPTEEAAIRMKAFTATFDDQDAATRKANNRLSTYNKTLSETQSLVTGLINSSVSNSKGLVDLTKPPGMVGGYDPNGPAANFGRMWDVAVNGFKSEWLAPLQQMGLIPDSVVAAGEETLKKFAERAATNFQKGTDLSLLDKGAIEAQVKEKLAAKAALDKLVNDVMADLSGQGVKGPGVKAAVQEAVGVTPSLEGDGSTSAGSFKTGFIGGMSGIGAAIVATLAAETKKTSDDLMQAGTKTGGVWAGGFMVSVNALPKSVYATLAAMVAPDVARILAQGQQRSGKPVE